MASDLNNIKELDNSCLKLLRNHGIFNIKQLSELSYDIRLDETLSHKELKQAINLAKLHVSINSMPMEPLLTFFPTVLNSPPPQHHIFGVQQQKHFESSPPPAPPLLPPVFQQQLSPQQFVQTQQPPQQYELSPPSIVLPPLKDEDNKEQIIKSNFIENVKNMELKIRISPWSLLKLKNPRHYELLLQFLKEHNISKKVQKFVQQYDNNIMTPTIMSQKSAPCQIVMIYDIDNVNETKLLFFCILKQVTIGSVELFFMTPLKTELFGKFIQKIKQALSLKVISLQFLS